VIWLSWPRRHPAILDKEDAKRTRRSSTWHTIPFAIELFKTVRNERAAVPVAPDVSGLERKEVGFVGTCRRLDVKSSDRERIVGPV